MEIHHSAEVVSGLWIGTEDAPQDEDFLEENNIALVIDLTDFHKWESSKLEVIGIMLNDIEHFNPDELESFKTRVETAIELISSYRTQGRNILVHCQMGINRSAFVIGYYLINVEKYSYDDTLNLLTQANRNRGQYRTLLNQTFRKFLQGVYP